MRGCVTRKGKRYYAVADLGPDPSTGKRRRKWVGGFDRKKEAEAALAALIESLNKGTYVEAPKQTVAEFLTTWAAGLRPPAGNLRLSTWVSYERNLRQHVVPRLGALRLRSLTPAHLNAIYAELLRSGHLTRGGPLAARTVAYIHAILHRALKDACRWGLIAKNPADLADPPRKSATKAPERTIWTPEQLRAFIHSIAGHRLFAAFVLVATTGLRRGELAGLRWEYVDLETGRISIRRTLISVDYRIEHSQPKSERSRRSVTLDPFTVAALRAHRARQLQERLAAGTGWIDTGLVFANEDGSMVHPDHFSNVFEGLAKKAGLPRIRFHDLRHSYATAALIAGVRPKIVSARLGHASIGITLDTYSHVVPELEQEAADSVAALILGPVPGNPDATS